MQQQPIQKRYKCSIGQHRTQQYPFDPRMIPIEGKRLRESYAEVSQCDWAEANDASAESS